MERTPSDLIGIMATWVEVAEASYPTTFNNNQITPMEGKSLVPLLENRTLADRSIFWEHEGNRAVRQGKWKLISRADKSDPFIWDSFEQIPEQEWELYDMEADRTETNNLAASNQEKVEELSDLWQSWAVKTGATPRPE